MSDHAEPPTPPAEDIPLTASPGTPGEGRGEALSSADTRHRRTSRQSCHLPRLRAAAPHPPPRFTASRASNLTALSLALALHAALLSLAYVYHITTKPTELPDLPLPQGFATESADAAPATPLSPSPTPPSRRLAASRRRAPPSPTPPPKTSSPHPPPTPPHPDRPALPDLALGPTEDTTDLPPPSTNTIPARPRPASNSVAAGQPPADAPANQSAATQPPPPHPQPRLPTPPPPPRHPRRPPHPLLPQ